MTEADKYGRETELLDLPNPTSDATILQTKVHLHDAYETWRVGSGGEVQSCE